MDMEHLPTDIVRLTNPANDAERDATYEVVENNGDRVMIRLQCNLPIQPIETVRPSDIRYVYGGPRHR
jgi:hypothetical protein